MNKIITAIFSICALALSFSASAQKIPFFTEFNTDINVNGGNPLIGFKLGLYKETAPNMRIGAGIGIMEETTFKMGPSIPIFGRAEFDLAKKGAVVPTLSFDLGYAINTENLKLGNLFINPSVNVRFNDKFYFGVGYLGGTAFTKGAKWGSNISLRLGLFFRANNNTKKIGSGISKFFKRTRFGLDLVCGFSGSKKYQDWNREYETRNYMRALAGFHWLYVFNEHWATGLGLRLGIVNYTYIQGDTYSKDDENKTEMAGNLFWRTEYTYKEVAKNLKPFACLDLGFSDANFTLVPQIGIKFKDKYRLGFAPAWGSRMWYDAEKSGLNYQIHLGIDF